ncbi:MAG TPA: hypothetical protein DEP72_00660 [Clostridiales bacterium]|nr:MAG: hypothetical protein A2Y18_02920 [Clostridiales bacterium GWD2_32_19]HCC06663.1 hypothetical protein [Clostridiales bacterium]
MVTYNENDLIKAIVREYKCLEDEANRIKNYAKDLDESLQQVMDEWIECGKICDYMINGVNIQYIMNKLPTSFLGAVMHMNKFINNPSEVEKFKKLRIINKDI